MQLLKTCICLLTLLATPGIAQNTDKPIPPAIEATARALPQEVLNNITRRQDQFLRDITNRLFQLTPDGKVTQERIDLWDSVQKATARFGLIGQIIVLDLNGDGNVTIGELADANQFADPRRRGNSVSNFAEADTNSDEVVTYPETVAWAIKLHEKNPPRVNNRYSIMAFDTDKDGIVDLPEITKVVRAANSLGLISVPAPRRQPNPRVAEVCTAPSPSADAEVVLISGHSGGALSTVAISGYESTTTVASLTIEAGEKPLYIYASSRNIVLWKVDGAIDRVEKFIVQRPSRSDNGAVSGIVAKKVAFTGSEACLEPFHIPGGGAAKVSVARLSTHFDRPVDHVIAASMFNKIAVPSGEGSEVKIDRADTPFGNMKEHTFEFHDQVFRLSNSGVVLMRNSDGTIPLAQPNSNTYLGLGHRFPLGVVTIDPANVVSENEVSTYDVLPGEIGLAQLLAVGSLETMKDRYILIRKAIPHLPANLSTGSRRGFILPKGIPLPQNAESIKVLSEETGACIAGTRCR